MALIVTFLLGVANFALHKAMLESHHPMLKQMPWFEMLGGRFSMGLEFLMLLGALLLTASGYPGWGWAYLAYSALNALSAWLILSRRV